MINKPDWIPIPDAVKLSGYTAIHLRRLLRQKAIVADKFGTVWAIYKPSLEEYLRRQAALGAKRGPKG